ncbi:hypothetical protein C8R43DRAFT_1136538 [Mycena crocata]|nr:hypothetical protein C8R43DRAFT_1136538 [Mycena crocata]
MPPKPPSEVRIDFLFVDKYHRSDPQLRTIVMSDTTFREMHVVSFIRSAESEHRTECKNGQCNMCPGAMWVKSAWMVDLPIGSGATVQEALEDIPLDSLEHDPAHGIEFMSPHILLSQYIRHFPGEGVIRVLFECTFDTTDQFFKHKFYDASPSKRLRTLSDDPNESSAKKPKLQITQPRGIRVIPCIDPTGPVDLLPPSSLFPSYVAKAGVVFVDKSRIIPPLDNLLSKHVGCFIALPPGTGKTFLKSMIAAWYHYRIRDPATFQSLFGDLEIGPIVQEPHKRRVLCLMFDLRELPEVTTGVGNIARTINVYVCQTIQAFAIKYQAELGTLTFSGPEKRVEANMLTRISQCLSRSRSELFICVDHWDAPILRAMASKEPSQAVKDAILTIAKDLTNFLSVLTRHRPAVVKLLIIGNIPPFPDDKERLNSVKNISLAPAMVEEKAFGMSQVEVSGLFSVLSHGRSIRLSLDGSVPNSTLGSFYPPLLSPEDASPDLHYNFNLVLHHAARTLSLRNKHSKLPGSPSLISISHICEKVLKNSSLRRGHCINIASFTEIGIDSLTSFSTNELVLWKILFYLGALKVDDTGKEPDFLWALVISSPYAASQLFARYPRMLTSELDASVRDIQLRALLERDPKPIAAAVAVRLERKPLQELYKMSEAVFQEMFDGYFGEDKYINNYFTQIGLLTNTSKAKAETSRQQSAKGKGPARQPGPTTAGLGRYGYLDIFICALLRMRRVVAIELKYFSVYGFFRAFYDSDEKTENAVSGTLDDYSKFNKSCLKKLHDLGRMSLEELRTQDYAFYHKDQNKKVKVSIKPFGTLLDNAATQLQSYLNAIVNGQAQDNAQGARVGITKAERRIEINPRDEVDEVIGFVVCGIGRRIITIPVEPKTQNTRYQYKHKSGWQGHWEKYQPY